MTIEKLKAVIHTQPFRPFTIHMADGRRIGVPHPDFIALSPVGRTVIVEHDDGTHSVLDLLLMTELNVGNGTASGKRRSKKSS